MRSGIGEVVQKGLTSLLFQES